MDADTSDIRMNHYWGARLQNWGDDTKDILDKTVFDDSAIEISENIQNELEHG